MERLRLRDASFLTNPGNLLLTKLSVTPQQTPKNRNLRLILRKKINSINARYSAVLGCEQGLKRGTKLEI
jgi:hypothetical protein